MTLFANLISYYKSSDLNDKKLEMNSVVLIDGSIYTVPKNKPLLLHFWATWCPVCKLEAPNIDLLAKEYNILTIAVQSGTDKELLSHMKEHDYNFKVINDKDGLFAKQFNVNVYPTTFIYDKDKNLQFSDVGYTSSFGLWLRLFWASL